MVGLSGWESHLDMMFREYSSSVKNDLIAPVEVGESMLNDIGTGETDRASLVLEHSRHGAENGNREILQRAVVEFVEEYR